MGHMGPSACTTRVQASHLRSRLYRLRKAGQFEPGLFLSNDTGRIGTLYVRFSQCPLDERPDPAPMTAFFPKADIKSARLDSVFYGRFRPQTVMVYFREKVKVASRLRAYKQISRCGKSRDSRPYICLRELSNGCVGEKSDR